MLEGHTYLNGESGFSDTSISNDDELVEGAHCGCVCRVNVDANA